MMDIHSKKPLFACMIVVILLLVAKASVLHINAKLDYLANSSAPGKAKLEQFVLVLKNESSPHSTKSITVSSFSEFLKLHKVRVTQEFPNLTMLPKSHAVRTTTIQITYCP